jgi:hypothetical protein
MCIVQLPPGGNPLAVNKYIISIKLRVQEHERRDKLFNFRRLIMAFNNIYFSCKRMEGGYEIRG